MCASFRSGEDALDRGLELGHRDLLLTVPRRQQRGFVDQVLEVGTGHAGRTPREHVEVDTVGQRCVACVDPQDSLAALEIGGVDDDLAVEAPRPQQRGSSMSGRFVAAMRITPARIETVELDEQLVQRLLALVVPAAEPGAALGARPRRSRR